MTFSGHTASFKIGVSKVQDFGNFELIAYIIFPSSKEKSHYGGIKFLGRKAHIISYTSSFTLV